MKPNLSLFGDSRAGQVRRAAVAARFYPSDPGGLRQLVTELLAQAPAPAGPQPKALLVSHAGYAYSGPIAASAYAAWAGARGVIRRIVLLGPSHFVPVEGLAVSSAIAFATPLGQVPVDKQAVAQLKMLAGVTVLDAAHAQEHCLEVQLPFLQVILEDFVLVPLVSGDASPELIAQALDALWGGAETGFVISSDLSHYLDAETSRRVDRETANAIERLEPEAIGEMQACGRVPIRGLLRAARARGMHASTLDLRNSGETGGRNDRVVGYGAFAFQEQER